MSLKELFGRYIRFTTLLPGKIVPGEPFGYVNPFWRCHYFKKFGIPIAVYQEFDRQGDYILVYNRCSQEWRLAYEPIKD